MAVSKDSALYALIIGSEDDPIPALRAAYNARIAANNPINAERINDAINRLIDAELDIKLALNGDVPGDLGALMATHGEAVQTCQTLLSKESTDA
jgi:hypothetical protein